METVAALWEGEQSVRIMVGGETYAAGRLFIRRG